MIENEHKSFKDQPDEINKRRAKVISKIREKQAYFDDIPQTREARISKAYEYFIWRERNTISGSTHKYDVSEDEILAIGSGTRTTQTYEYYKGHDISKLSPIV
jgi:hypothetical protein